MATENNGDQRPTNPIGVYKHNESGESLHITDPIQGDAVVRMGFVRTGDLPKKVELSTEDNSEAIAQAQEESAKARLAQYDAAALKAEEQAIAEQNERKVAADKAVSKKK